MTLWIVIPAVACVFFSLGWVLCALVLGQTRYVRFDEIERQ